MLTVLYLWRLLVSGADTSFPPSLSFILRFLFLNFFFILVAAITPGGSPKEERTCLYMDSTLKTDLLIYISALSLLISQECDQVHIDDVASDDNGQDLR